MLSVMMLVVGGIFSIFHSPPLSSISHVRNPTFALIDSSVGNAHPYKVLCSCNGSVLTQFCQRPGRLSVEPAAANDCAYGFAHCCWSRVCEKTGGRRERMKGKQESIAFPGCRVIIAVSRQNGHHCGVDGVMKPVTLWNRFVLFYLLVFA